MGIIQSGILSKVSGKVAGVVGGSWKDKAYLRAWVTPANPNTVSQQAQRTKFAECVAFLKPLVGQVAQEYWDPFQKKMSGFNAMLKANIGAFPTLVNPLLIKMTEGPLSAVALTSAVYASPNVTVTFTPNLGNNGLVTDKVNLVVYDRVTKRVYFAAAEVARSVGSIVAVTEAGLVAGDLFVFLITSRLAGTTRTLVGPSVVFHC